MSDADDPLGYAYNPGGLNNQRVALLGLVLEGLRRNMPVALPDFYNLDHAGGACDAVPFDAAYEPAPFEAFARAHGLTVTASRPSTDTPEASWAYFGAGATHIAVATADGRMRPDDVACDLFRHLVPRIRSEPEFAHLRQAVFDDRGISLVIQMRIESDWRLFSAITLLPTVGDGEDYLPTFGQILTKVRNTLGGDNLLAYVVCDEASLGEDVEEIRRIGLERFGIRLFWKTDILGKDFTTRRTVLDRSLVDFEMASMAERFVGLTRSSFSNMATFQRYCITRAQVVGHYVYNIPGDLLHERHDNGAYAFAAPAVAVRDAAPTLLVPG